MANFKTPGVYIEEIPRLGSSIAGVPTAVAGFSGYTEKAIIDGDPWIHSSQGIAPPVRITSLLQYEEVFGGPFKEEFTVNLTGTVPTPTVFSVSPSGPSLTDFILYYQVRMFFANGGGTCWIVSVDSYSNSITEAKLTGGIQKFAQIDEVTLLAAPESVFLSANDRKTVNTEMLSQCAKLQDRFALLDTVHIANNTIFQDASDFRDDDIGPDNLKYAAAYYPALETPIGYFYRDEDVAISDTRSQQASPYDYDYNGDNLSTILNGANAFVSITVSGGTGPLLIVPDDNLSVEIPTFSPVTIAPGTIAPSATTVFESIAAIINFINTHTLLSQYVQAVDTSTTTGSFKIVSKLVGTVGNGFEFAFNANTRYVANITGPNFEGGKGAEKDLYNRIKAELATFTLNLYPSATMAGVYARVDGTRGVWKAPANVGLALVNKPAINIDADNQENLNVDSVSGKSINAIRQFAGRGTLVWGARTLAGNDNEWRYINVRRLFIYVEESCKKATEFVVFEGNTAVTWNRVKNMIEAFLTDLWRDGALAGATTKDAFFVQVGLGTTMTPNDILNGKMIVRIGIAAARPAEFIILQFEHKLQES